MLSPPNEVSILACMRARPTYRGPICVFTNVNNPRAKSSRMDELRTTPIGRGASIGVNATIICGHSLGECCFVGAGRSGDQGRAGLRADGGQSGATDWLDKPRQESDWGAI